MWLRRNDRQAVLPVFGKHYLPEHVPGSGIAIRLRKAFSSAAEHSASRSLSESSAADSSGSRSIFAFAFCTMFSRARLSAERMIAKLVRFANIEVSGALAEFALMRAASWASLAGPVRLPVPVKFSIANRALRHVLVNDSLRLGFSGLIF